MSKVRTRFAPSPTGSLHVGGARTALFNYLFAKKLSGIFVLRIEDTDVARSTAAHEEVILRDLRWLSIEWQEGPDTSGPFKPYRQSERKPLYLETLERLQTENHVYRCFCTEIELESRRKAALGAGQTPRYDGRCSRLTDAQISAFEAEGKPYAWRFRIDAHPAETVTVHDLVRGDVSFETELTGDFVLLKSNGLPSYNFACVVDDHFMEISHVIRGDEHLTNTPRQIMLYKALGWNVPTFAHLSMILAPDHTKLSKRHGTTAVSEFKDKGFLPHAIVNYISLLGWSPKDEREIFLPQREYADAAEALRTLINELSAAFSLEAVQKNPAVFDNPKLSWMNGQYIRLLKQEDLVRPVMDFLKIQGKVGVSRESVEAILSTQRQNFETLTSLAGYAAEFFTPGQVELEESAKEVLGWPWAVYVFGIFKQEIVRAETLTFENVPPLMKRIQTAAGKKGKDLYWPVRVALTGKTHGPELTHLLPILGKEEVLKRFEKTGPWFWGEKP